MTTAISYPNASDLATDDYIVIGLATCFVKEDGEVSLPRWVWEFCNR